MKKSPVIYEILGTLCLIGAFVLYVFSSKYYEVDMILWLYVSLSASIAILGIVLICLASIIRQNNAIAKKNDDIAEQLLWVNNKLTALIKQNSGSAESGKTKPSEPAE